jgi:hypothetical protein
MDIVALAAEPDIAGRCRLTAEKYFSLQAGIEKYSAIYQALSAQ